MAFVEDLSAFFDTAGFAVTATFADLNTVDGILDKEYYEEYNTSGYSPVFMCPTTSVNSYDEGDTLTIDSINYTIDTKEQDGTGVSIIRLRVT